MCKEKKVIYVSCWDGCEDIETEAVVNIETGEVICSSPVETSGEYVNCIGEFVKYDENNIEQVVFDGYSGTIVSKSNENYHVITIHGINFTVSEELEKEDIQRIYSIAY